MKKNASTKVTPKQYEWMDCWVIPQYLIQEISDRGMVETYDEKFNRVDSDDLRIAVIISAGFEIVLDGHTRVVVVEGGHLMVQALVEV